MTSPLSKMVAKIPNFVALRFDPCRSVVTFCLPYEVVVRIIRSIKVSSSSSKAAPDRQDFVLPVARDGRQRKEISTKKTPDEKTPPRRLKTSTFQLPNVLPE